MARIEQKGNNVSIQLSGNEAKDAAFDTSKEYEFKKVKDGIWLMLEKEEDKQIDSLEKKIIEMLSRKPLSERVEGKFEKLLNAAEIKKLNDMLKEGKVVKFKLGEKYKKAVYKLKAEVDASKARENASANAEKNKSDGETSKEEKIPQKEQSRVQPGKFDFEKSGFIFFSDEFSAKQFSQDNYDRMKSKEIIGLKSFDGNCYFVKKKLYEEKSKAIIELLSRKKGAYLSELGSLLKDRLLAKAICEILKEEGLIIEKRKEFYEAL